MIQWNGLKDCPPPERKPLLLACCHIQEAQVGWFEGGALWRWKEGRRASAMSGVTHWAIIDWPILPNADVIQTWEKAFEIAS